MQRAGWTKRAARSAAMVVPLLMALGCAEKEEVAYTPAPPPPQPTPRYVPPPQPVYVPPPAPPPRVERPAGPSYSEWLPKFKSRRWQGIVIHHTAIPDKGNAATIDRAHKGKGWEGLGYHFVIGNGTGSKDGEVEVGFRWKVQREGAHAKVPGAGNWWNEHTIGIVLVGNFMNHPPSDAQIRSTVALTGWLCREFNIPASRVYFHREVKQTECPGVKFPRQKVRAMIRDAVGR